MRAVPQCRVEWTQLQGYPGCHHQIQRTKRAGHPGATPCPKISAVPISSAFFFIVLPFYVCPQSPVTWQRVVLICCLCPRRLSPQESRGSSGESVQVSYVVCEFVVMAYIVKRLACFKYESTLVMLDKKCMYLSENLGWQILCGMWVFLPPHW